MKSGLTATARKAANAPLNKDKQTTICGNGSARTMQPH